MTAVRDFEKGDRVRCLIEPYTNVPLYVVATKPKRAKLVTFIKVKHVGEARGYEWSFHKRLMQYLTFWHSVDKFELDLTR